MSENRVRRVRKVAFTMIPIQNPTRARAFYEQVLGLVVGQHGSQGHMHWIEYDLPDGGCIAITTASKNVPSASAGSTVALEVDDLDGLIAHLKAHEVPLHSDIIHGPRCRMIVCEDPEGNSLLLHQLNPS